MAEPAPPPPELSSNALECWCNTQVKVDKVSFRWTINNFSTCHKEIGELLNSAAFPEGATNKVKWCLQVEPKYLDEDKNEYLSLFLILMSSDKTAVRAKFKFSILNARKMEINSTSSETHEFHKGHGQGYMKFIRRSFLMNSAYGLLPDDKLTISCEVSVFTDTINESGQSKNGSTPVNVRDLRLSEDFEGMFEKMPFSDVTLCVNGQELQAHKVVLAARSPVFNAMFEHEMEESNKNRVEITDIEHEVMRELLRFIYTGKAPNIERMANGMLAAADKYALDRLKEMCEESLSSNLTIDNVCEVLVLAYLHTAEQLKYRAIDFIKEHVTDVVERSGWKTMIKTHPHVVADNFQSLADAFQALASAKSSASEPSPSPAPPTKRKRKRKLSAL